MSELASTIVADIQGALHALKDPDRAAKMSRFFKEPIVAFGLPAAEVKQLATEFGKQLPKNDKSVLVSVCEQLFAAGSMEECLLACHLSYKGRKLFSQGDMALFESWIMNYVTNWAVCDTLCNRTVGDVLLRHPDAQREAFKWTSSDNRWMKRAAAVSFIYPAKKWKDLTTMLEVCDTLLEDRDDMVQKGYGWLLKELSVRNFPEIHAFIATRKDRMPRTALRYAIEKFPEAERREMMLK
ncbi:MAG: hypothetical protein RL226_1488 [Bacteroidota bacterium]